MEKKNYYVQNHTRNWTKPNATHLGTITVVMSSQQNTQAGILSIKTLARIDTHTHTSTLNKRA